jgi:hypothetical protein
MQVMGRVTVVVTLLPGATTNLCLSPGWLAVYAGVILAMSVLAASVATAESVTVSRLSRAPRVNEFANPESSSIQTEMATIERLIQRTPVHSPLVSDPWAGDRRGCHYRSTGAVAVSRGHLGDGHGLAIVYVIWMMVVVTLYVPCRWFAEQKHRHSKWWLSYL